MKVKTAVAYSPKQPLSIEMVNLEGQKVGFWLKLKLPAFVIQTLTLFLGPTQRDYFRQFSVTKALEWWLMWGQRLKV